MRRALCVYLFSELGGDGVARPEAPKPEAQRAGVRVLRYSRRLFICFLQRVSIAACYAERCTSYSKSVRPSVCLSVTRCVKTTQSIRSCGLHWRI